MMSPNMIREIFRDKGEVDIHGQVIVTVEYLASHNLAIINLATDIEMNLLPIWYNYQRVIISVSEEDAVRTAVKDRDRLVSHINEVA